MSNQGEFTSGGVIKVTTLPTPLAGVLGDVYYLLNDIGDYERGHYTVQSDGSGGYEWVAFGGGGGGSFVWIYDVEAIPAGTAITNKILSSSNTVIEESTSSTDQVRIHVRATGGSEYLPIVVITALDGTTLVDSGAVSTFTLDGAGPEWNGYVDLDVGPDSGVAYDRTLLAEHADGGKDDSLLHVIFGPVITAITFTEHTQANGSSYPTTNGVVQSELKQGDIVQVRVQADAAAPEMTGIVFTAPSGDLLASQIDTGNFSGTYDTTVSLIINRTTNSAMLRTLTAKAHKADGAFGEEFTSAGVDGSSGMTTNNITPSVSMGTVSYPASQQALKGSETASFTVTASNHDLITPAEFNTPDNEVQWNTTVLNSSNTVERIAGLYNVVFNNIQVVVYRSTNGRSNSVQSRVYIAEAVPDITITEPVKLMSSPGGQGSTVTISSSQDMLDMNIASVPEGSLGPFSGSGTNRSSTLTVLDTATKGVHAYGTLNTTNLAGKTTHNQLGDNTYEIGGFLERDLLYVAAFSRIALIGTRVSDPTKLLVEETFESANSGSPNFAYSVVTTGTAVGSIVDKSDSYVVIDNTTQLVDPNGDALYVMDSTGPGANATGTLVLRVEETPS